MKYTTEELEAAKLHDIELGASDKLYCNYSYKRKLKYNKDIEYLDTKNIVYTTDKYKLTINFNLADRHYHFYCSSNKWRNAGKAVYYRSKGIEQLIELINKN